MMIEELKSAVKRGAYIYGEFLGGGESSDGYKWTGGRPKGKLYALALERAIKDSGITPEEITYFDGHGSSTRLGDRLEDLAFQKAVGKEHIGRIHVSSIKSMIAHLIGAANATELAGAILAAEQGFVPPTINYEKDPGIGLNVVGNEPVDFVPGAILSGSAGFTGHNTGIVFMPREMMAKY